MCWQRTQLGEGWGLHTWHWDFLECPGCPQNCSRIPQGTPPAFKPRLLLLSPDLPITSDTLATPGLAFDRCLHGNKHPPVYLFIPALSPSPRCVGSFVLLKCFGRSGVISGFVWKRNTLKGGLFIYFVLFLGGDAEGGVNHSARSSPGKELKEPEIKYNSSLIILW